MVLRTASLDSVQATSRKWKSARLRHPALPAGGRGGGGLRSYELSSLHCPTPVAWCSCSDSACGCAKLPKLKGPSLLGGSWVVRSRAISRATITLLKVLN